MFRESRLFPRANLIRQLALHVWLQCWLLTSTIWLAHSYTATILLSFEKYAHLYICICICICICIYICICICICIYICIWIWVCMCTFDTQWLCHWLLTFFQNIYTHILHTAIHELASQGVELARWHRVRSPVCIQVHIYLYIQTVLLGSEFFFGTHIFYCLLCTNWPIEGSKSHADWIYAHSYTYIYI